MWHCPECEFWNDEPSTECARCGRQRGEALSGARAKPEATGEDQRRRSRWGWLEWTALGVIAACVLALGFFGYSAWQRGTIRLDLSSLWAGDESGAGEGGSGPEADVAELLAQDHPLAVIYTVELRSLRHLRPHAELLLAVEEELAGLSEPVEWEEDLTEEARALRSAAGAAAEELLAQYGDFEQDCLRYSEPELEPYQQLVRNEYVNQLVAALTLIGAVYAHDKVGQDAAYALSDKMVVAVEQHLPVQVERLTEAWAEAVRQRSQFLLDLEQQEEYRQLAARLAGMAELHRGFQESLNELPPYNIRSGKLDKHGRAALELLDSLAASIEGMTLEFEDYRATLNENLLSDRNRGLIIKLEDLCQEDHLYAFTEIYRIYAQDRKLDHPAYAELALHFEFVLEHWPRQEMAYRRVYNQFEAEWAAVWARD